MAALRHLGAWRAAASSSHCDNLPAAPWVDPLRPVVETGSTPEMRSVGMLGDRSPNLQDRTRLTSRQRSLRHHLPSVWLCVATCAALSVLALPRRSAAESTAAGAEARSE